MTNIVMTAELQLALSILLLLVVINSAPILLKRLLNTRLASPVDGGTRFIDGRPLFGKSKTVRGVIVAIVVGALAAPFAGVSMPVGAGLAAASMAGDLVSSFTKRRLGLAPSSRAVVLDQVPEALLPLLFFKEVLALNGATIAGIVIAFLLLDVLLSRMLFRMGVRDQPH